jgi:hypothetical protein
MDVLRRDECPGCRRTTAQRHGYGCCIGHGRILASEATYSAEYVDVLDARRQLQGAVGEHTADVDHYRDAIGTALDLIASGEPGMARDVLSIALGGQ